MFLTIRSADSHALELAASGANVQLRRVVKVGHRGPERRRSLDGHCKYIADAVFWPYERDNPSYEEHTRELQGEVIIPKGTTPSFTFADIVLRVSLMPDLRALPATDNSVQYEIVLCHPTFSDPFDVSHKAVVSDTNPVALSSTSIVVTAASPRHPAPLSSSPPAYAQ